MYICRLFKRDQPFEQVEARLLAEGRITIGRDAAADWPLPDLEGFLSRIHCTLAVEGGRVLLTDSSSNGTFLDDGGRVPAGEAVPIDCRSSFHLGALTILVDHAPAGAETGADRTRPLLPLGGVAPAVPSNWLDGAPAARPPHRDASLIEAFCEGARIDASELSGEDPADLMRRAGAIYQQTILGLATLMGERTRMKGQYQLDRTRIGAVDNNPFKWTPTRRLAQSLLASGKLGFLSDAEAVRASFADIGCHLAAIGDGAGAALQLALDTLSPDSIDAEARTHGLSLRGRAATCRDIHGRRHAGLLATDGSNENALSRAFAKAYEAHDPKTPA
ncbi:type VI secretion system-associated FHA domain protein [Sphingomonas solaris]|uniref:FHA domain-containing protein n=1 Tax=Alterirhizorhabdus solaris TaxID=2529389 RepID=A0A558QX29_9SPHN|nr:type VI secretion system-associated FHA domain protein [Sphingomonas solaris]TVV71704.1 FHA domain-containing protein [Sphingomonas solaris]